MFGVICRKVYDNVRGFKEERKWGGVNEFTRGIEYSLRVCMLMGRKRRDDMRLVQILRRPVYASYILMVCAVLGNANLNHV